LTLRPVVVSIKESTVLPGDNNSFFDFNFEYVDVVIKRFCVSPDSF
jgi:hypothetical protein